MKKKILSLFLALMLCAIPLVSCTNGGGEDTDTAGNDSTSDIPAVNDVSDTKGDTEAPETDKNTEDPDTSADKDETDPVTSENDETETEPAETEKETDPVTTEPKDTETDPVTTEPKDTETDPVTTEPKDTETDPVTTEPEDTETDPVTTEPKDTETDPVTTEPKDTETETEDTSADTEPEDTDEPREVQSLKYVALGDSIAQGYALPDVRGQRYSTLLAAMIDELEFYDCEVHNYAVSGHTSDDMLELLALGSAAELEGADIVTVSIGANNVLRPAIDSLSKIYIYSMISDPALRNQMVNQLKDQLMLLTAQGVEDFKNDLPDIIDAIREKAPDARIIFQTVYNPFRNFNLDIGLDASFLDMKAESDLLVKDLNEVILDSADKYGYEVVDIYTAFADKLGVVNVENYTGKLTDIQSAMMAIDPHPTEKGHRVIAEAIFAHLKLD